MRIACEEGITQREQTGNDKWLKEFIHLYFNSKYARKGYTIHGENYSLIEDISQRDKDNFSVVEKYIQAITLDNSGSEIDNVKHLLGATSLCLRDHPNHIALQLLYTYSVAFLGIGENDSLKTKVYNSYIGGFIGLYEVTGSAMWDSLALFNNYLDAKAHNEPYIQEELINKGKEAIMLFIHEDILNTITQQYVN